MENKNLSLSNINMSSNKFTNYVQTLANDRLKVKKQNRKLFLCKVPQYENKTKRIRNIMSETTFTGKRFSSQVNLHKQCD